MVSSLPTLGIAWTFLLCTIALLPKGTFAALAPAPDENPTPSLASSRTPIILPDLHSNTNISLPTCNQQFNPQWAVECGQDTIPPGWPEPPFKRRITNPIDCASAIYRVTQSGDPEEPQIWEAQARWYYRTCGVFLVPGWSFAHVNFPRCDMAEIGQQIAQKCVDEEHGFMGGWVAIGGYFVVLLTGKQPNRIVAF